MNYSIEEDELYMAIYSLQSLCNRGISIPDTVRTSLTNLVMWYECSNDKRFLDEAVLQLRALFRMGLAVDRDLEIYENVCRLAGLGEEQYLEYGLFRQKKIRANKTQIRAIIQRWMPSETNSMTKEEVVEDILDKLRNRLQGQYLYCYQKYTDKKTPSHEAVDYYRLVIEEQCGYILALKDFRCYSFRL